MSAPVAETAPARRRGPGRALGAAAVPLLLLLALLAAGLGMLATGALSPATLVPASPLVTFGSPVVRARTTSACSSPSARARPPCSCCPAPRAARRRCWTRCAAAPCASPPPERCCGPSPRSPRSRSAGSRRPVPAPR
ncbi:hypothetical protein [Brachybacterium sp. GPGPB12]|uniref:hypothetical protein n=1 Tax=Brachybacterium sp. GPGPB12 TaxID=3023517 RepID=UPI00313449FE